MSTLARALYGLVAVICAFVYAWRHPEDPVPIFFGLIALGATFFLGRAWWQARNASEAE